MRYVVYLCIGMSLMLMFYGVLVVSGAGVKSAPDSRVVYIDSDVETARFLSEIDHLKTIAAIREVLEVYYPSISIEEKREVAETIYEACKIYDLKAELVLAVMKTESAFDDTAVSHRGAMGLMQVLPNTGQAMAEEIDFDWASKNNLFDRRTNIMLGSYYLKKMLNRYERLDHALLAYNTGPTRLDQMLLMEKEMPRTYAEMVYRNLTLLAQDFFAWSEESDQLQE